MKSSLPHSLTRLPYSLTRLPHSLTRLPQALLLAIGLATSTAALADNTPSTATSMPSATALAAQLSDPAIIAKGKYMAQAGDCVSCHTASNGKPFAGGRAITTPFGTLFTPNITPDATTGLGKWSFDDFWQALHYGKGRQGQLLYPAFSYTSFTRVKKDDAVALFAYLKSLEPVRRQDLKPQLDFPFSIRKTLYAWRALYFTPGVYQPDTTQSPQWNRGAYLVKGLGHCNECHTERNSLGAMNQDTLLSGGTIPAQGWYAPDLSMKPGGGLEGWTRQDIVELLKTGTSSRGAVFGPMADVVRNSTQHLTDADLNAIAVYLDSLPARATKHVEATAKAANYAAGKQVFEKNCAACHGSKGQGADAIYPPLAGNSTVIEPTGISAIRSVLLGGFPPATAGNPQPYSMPPYAPTLSDDEVAAVVNYIRQSWGNMATPVQAVDVKKYRAMPAH